MTSRIEVLVWGENRHEKTNPKVREIYPQGIHECIADFLRLQPDYSVNTAWLDQPEHGVPVSVLESTDVLLWWGHARHGEVADELAERVAKRVQEGGMGFIALHSAHYSKAFKKVVNGKGDLKGGWRESTDTEEITVCAPWHPIAEGIENFVIGHEEMYGGPFDVPLTTKCRPIHKNER